MDLQGPASYQPGPGVLKAVDDPYAASGRSLADRKSTSWGVRIELLLGDRRRMRLRVRQPRGRLQP